jgi:predicted lipid carrier protein YhbT
VIRNGALVPASRADESHVTIEGNLQDFFLLATRREDPDTLFFQRRLALIGDVAAGLCVKNLLDGIEYDWDAHVRAVLGPRGQPLAEPLRKWSAVIAGNRIC